MAYDNICKYLAEKYPAEFVQWLFSEQPSNIRVLKTELSAEPIHADSLILLQLDNKILHLEFQTLPKFERPMPFRMLRYYTRLQDIYWGQEILQVVIFLKQTNSRAVFTDRYQSSNTLHRYRVVRLWEEDPAPLLASPALLPLAPLAKSDVPENLLRQTAIELDKIENRDRQINISACSEVLAGLRFEANLIRQLLREDLMEESVIYQEILQKGLQKGQQIGRQEGRQEGELALINRLLARRFGTIETQTQARLQQLSSSQLEDLGESLFDLGTVSDLQAWLDRQD